MTHQRTLVFSALLCACMAASAQQPALRFYAPLDDHARGVLLPENVGFESPNEFERVPGVVGGAAVVSPTAGLQFPLKPFLSHEEGTVAVWLKINWDPKETATRGLINLGRFGWLWRWTRQQFLQFTLFYHHLDEKHDYGCQWKFRDWRPGEWRHFAITWSWSQRKRVMYIDGEPAAEAAIKRIPNVITQVKIGPDAAAADELCFYSRAVGAAEIKRLYEAGKAGKPAFDIPTIPAAQGALARLPKSAAPRPPEYVNWALAGAEQSDNGLRGEVTLNGWWRWQRGKTAYAAPDDAKWLYRKAPAQSSFTESFRPRDERQQIVQPKDPRVGQFKLTAIPQWYEREFMAPKAWVGRRLILKFDSFTHESAIWLNGELLDALPRENLGGDYDVTDRVRWDAANRLTVFSSGIDGDVTLASRPAAARIDAAWLVTSWRKKQVEARLRLWSAAARRARVRIDIFDRDAKTPVKQLGKLVALAAGTTELNVSAPWPNPKLWSMTRPHLYSYTVTLLDGAGKSLDATPAKRFGFREIWIDGGDFYLNGRPAHFIGHSNVHIVTAAELGDPEYIRYSLRRWKAAGLNCLTPWGHSRGGNPTFHPLFDAADELGVAVFLKPDLPTGERGGETPKLRAHWQALQKRYNERYRQHASALAWLIGSGSHPADFCPAMLDGKTPAKVAKAEPLRKTWNFVRSIDGTRPIFGLSNGDIGSVWTSMAYQGFDVDLQERENWPRLWSRTKHKPLMPCEFSLPCHPDWYTRTRGRSGRAQYHPKGALSIPTEYGAMYLGASVYAKEPEEFLKKIADSPGNPRLSNAFWQTKLLFADTLRAWRAYGMSFVYHAEVPAFFTGERPRFPSVAGLDPRRKGATPEALHGSLQAAEDLSEFGQRVKAATAPRMAYVGGPDGEFTLKDHVFYAGDRVRKVLVVVNETDEPLQVDGKWELRDARGRAVLTGRVGALVEPGRQDTTGATIEFAAPAVRQRTDYRLVVSADGLDAPAFALTVFPKSTMPAATGLVLFDPIGDTAKALKQLGVSAGPMPRRLAPHHRLIVGRGALLQKPHRDALAQAGFDAAVARGMRVLVMEQRVEGWDGALMGLRFKRLATRRAFVRGDGHPALAGLVDADFKYLAGHSNFIEAYERPATAPTAYPLHWWHWGNDNIVATYTIERPQVGAARALLDCGFDLGEAALLEVARGDGLIVFCQVDVTNRIGRDPVSTRLLGNLLAYLNATAPRPSAPSLSKLLAQHPAAAQVTGYMSPPPPVMGIHAGDLFFRGKLSLPAFDAKSQHPLFTRVTAQGKSYWITSLTGAALPTPWQRAKAGRVEAALRMANRERVTLGPTLAHSDDPNRLYPHNWQRIDTLKGDFDPYVYWRW